MRGLGYLLTPARCALISLALRLFLSATAWTVVILVVTGIVLSSVYRHAIERAFDRRLDVYLRTLVADVATPDEPPTTVPQSLGEPLFELPLSGWYWQITRSMPRSRRCARRVRCGTRTCRSSTRRRRRPRARTASASAMSTVPRTSSCAWSSATVDLGDDGRYLVAVAGDASEIDDETRTFDHTSGVTFGR